MKRHILILAAIVLAASCDKGFEDRYWDNPISWGEAVSMSNNELYQYCLDSLDTDNNGIITYEEIKDVTAIDCHSRGMNSLSGIEIFPKLDTVICYDNRLTLLDLSTVPNLKYLDCSQNQLKELNVSMTSISTLFACPMDGSGGKNLLNFLYIHQGQQIEFVTSNRKEASPKRLPDETVIVAIPAAKD